MKFKHIPNAILLTFTAIALSAACWADVPKYKMTTDIPESITTPDKVETSIGTFDYFDGVPSKATTDTVYDYMDRARAVEVFVNLIPAVSMYHLRQGMRDIDLTNSNQILIARDMPDSKPLVLIAVYLGFPGSQKRRPDGR